MKTILTILLLCASPAWAYPTITGPTTTTIGGFTKDTWRVDASADPIDHFEIYRVHAVGTFRGSLVLPNPLSFDFRIYEYDQNGVYANSTAGYVANAGFDVWGYSGRGFDVTAGACDVPFSCAIASTWNLATAVSDIEYVRALVMSTAPPPRGKQPAIGGLSLGAMVTIAAINTHPSYWTAAFIWEGGLYSADPSTVLLNTAHCADANSQLAAGVYMGPTAPFILDAQLAQSQPLVSHRAYMALLDGDADPPLPQTKVFVNYYFFAGNTLLDQWTYANDTRATDLFAKLAVNYAVQAELRDVPCSFAGNRTYTNNLSAFTGPVLAIGGDFGFGQAYADLLGLMTSASSKSSTVVHGFGHVDHWGVTNHNALVETPLVSWLQTVVFP